MSTTHTLEGATVLVEEGCETTLTFLVGGRNVLRLERNGPNHYFSDLSDKSNKSFCTDDPSIVISHICNVLRLEGRKFRKDVVSLLYGPDTWDQ